MIINNPLTTRGLFFFFGLALFFATVSYGVAAQDDTPVSNTAPADNRELHFAYGVMCEGIEAFRPVNISDVFPVSIGRVMCFTEFDDVPIQTEIYHDWVKQGELVFRKKLVLKPPSWSTVSSIQLRAADKGPWRVEVRRVDGYLLHILRFSITD